MNRPHFALSPSPHRMGQGEGGTFRLPMSPSFPSPRPSRLCGSTAPFDHPRPNFAARRSSAYQHRHVQTRRDTKMEPQIHG